MSGGHGRRVPMPPPAKTAKELWAIVCDAPGCTQEWGTNRRDAIDLGAVELHRSMEHPEMEKIALRLEWRGKGPAPESKPNRAARRAKAKKKGKL